MSNIKVQCIDQAIGFLNTPVISSGNVNYDTITFDFCSKWDGYTKTAIFYRTKDEVYYQILENDSCLIPNEVLREKGVIYIGVFGVLGDKTITSQVLRYRIDEGAVTEDLKPADPTPDIYSQIIALCTQIRTEQTDFINSWNKTVADTRDDMIKEVEDIIKNENIGDAHTLGGKSPSEYVTGTNGIFLDGETILSWANNPNGQYKKTITNGYAFPSDAPVLAEGFCELSTDTQGRKQVIFTTFNTSGKYLQYARSIFNNAWLNEWWSTADGGNAEKLGGKGASEYIAKDSGGIVTTGNDTPITVNSTHINDEVYIGYQKHGANVGWIGFKYGKAHIFGVGDIATTADLANYLPLSGGGIVEAQTPHPFGIKNSLTAESCYVNFNSKDGLLGYLGFYWDKPVYIDGATSSLRYLLHEGNVGDYAMPKSGGSLNGNLSINGISDTPLHVNANSGYDETYIGYLVGSTPKGYIGFKNGNAHIYQKGDILHTGNSSPIVPVNVDPGVGASVTYADGTVLFVYEEE